MWYDSMPNALIIVTIFEIFPYIEVLIENNLYNFLVNLTVGLIGILVGVLGIIISVKKKLPYYTTRRINFIRVSSDDLEKLGINIFKDELREFTVTKFVFWNAGNETIDSMDITKFDPLKIQIKNNYRLIDMKIICTNEIANQFSYCLSEDRTYANLGFDYVSKGEGILLQIVHTGATEDIYMTGTIKGTTKPTHKSVINIAKVHDFSLIPFIPKPVAKLVSIISFFCYPILVSKTILSYDGLNIYNIFTSILLVGITWVTGFNHLFLRRIPKEFEDIFFKD